MNRKPVIAWGPEKYCEVIDRFGRLDLYLILIENPKSKEAKMFCDSLFPGISDIIQAAMPYAHMVQYDGRILWFSHHLWDDDMEWYWSFTKE